MMDTTNSNAFTARTLSLLQFSIMVFVINCGGAYGVEYLIQTGGPAYTFLALSMVPFLFSLPQSLMCAELNSMMPCNHGYIVWVYRGLGEFWGWVNACNTILGTSLNLPLFAVLMVDYFIALFHVNPSEEWSSWILLYIIKLLFIFLAMILNVMNIKIVGNTVIIFTILILTPFLIGFLAAIPSIDPAQWTITTPVNADMTYNWPVFISSCLWLHCGFDRLSCISGETKFARDKFFVAFLCAIIMDWAAYVLPVIAALTVDYDASDWNKGYLLDAYEQLLPGIQYLLLIGAMLSMFALYVVELSAYARSVCAIAQPFIVITHKGKVLGMDDAEYEQEIMSLDRYDIEVRDESNFEDLSDYEDELLDPSVVSSPYEEEEKSFTQGQRAGSKYSKRFRVSICPSWIGHYAVNGAPQRAVIVQSLINCVLVAFSFEMLIQVAMFFFAIGWLLEFASFLRLKYTEPEALRPFAVPWGLFGAYGITIIKLCVVGVVIAITTYYDVKIFFMAIGYNFLICVLYGARSVYWQSKKLKYTKS